MSDFEITECRDAKRNKTEIIKIDDSKMEGIKTDDSKTEENKTDFSGCNQSHQSSDPSGTHSVLGYDKQGLMRKKQERQDAGAKMDAYRSCIRENIGYSCINKLDTGYVDELVELMVDTMMLPDSRSVRIGREERPASVVKGCFMKLKFPHIEYVLLCLQRHTGKIYNIKAYLLTVLYNSLLTISSFYRAEVRHDLYGCC